MRIRIAYKMNNKDVLEEGQINNFPQGLWSGAVLDGKDGAAQASIFSLSVVSMQSFPCDCSIRGGIFLASGSGFSQEYGIHPMVP